MRKMQYAWDIYNNTITKAKKIESNRNSKDNYKQLVKYCPAMKNEILISIATSKPVTLSEKVH